MGVGQYSLSCYFSGEYDNAIDGFKIYAKEYEEREIKPYVLFLIGKSYKALGDRESAKVYFTEIMNSYKNTDVYYDAVNEFRNL